MTGYNSKRQMSQDKLDDDDDTQVYSDTLLIVYQRGFADGKKSAERKPLTDGEMMRIYVELKSVAGFYSVEKFARAITALRTALEQPEQGPVRMPCVGKDPRCPCQDGDACHYKDCGNTKAWPVPQAEPTPWRDMVVVSLVREGIDKHRARELADHFAAQRPWVGLTDEDVNRESAPIAQQMKLAFHAGMYVAQKILKERNT